MNAALLFILVCVMTFPVMSKSIMEWHFLIFFGIEKRIPPAVEIQVIFKGALFSFTDGLTDMGMYSGGAV